MLRASYLVSSNLAGSCCGDESVGPLGCFSHGEPTRAGQGLQLTPALTLTTAGERNAAKIRAGLEILSFLLSRSRFERFGFFLLIPHEQSADRIGAINHMAEMFPISTFLSLISSKSPINPPLSHAPSQSSTQYFDCTPHRQSILCTYTVKHSLL